jgi:hypothetical protein
VHGEQAAAVDLRQVGAGDQAEAEDGGLERTEPDDTGADPEEDDEQPHDRRDAAQHVDDDARDPTQRGDGGTAAQDQGDAQ